MSDDQPSEKPSALKTAFSWVPIAVGLQVGCLTLLIVFVALVGGIFLDKLLGTKPVLTILLVLGSAPLALFLTFWIAMQEIKKVYPNSQASPGKTQARKEEDDRD